MHKYLYIFNYERSEKDLFLLEYQYLFNEEFHTRHLLTSIDVDPKKSVFIKIKLTIMYASNNIKDIIQRVTDDQLYYLDFKVIYYKNDVTNVDYQESLNWCRALAYPIDGSVNMKEPQVIFALTKIGDTFYFGTMIENNDWHKHENKPYSYSHSLTLRLARTLINFAIKNDSSLSIIDPCCGVGTVVLEGLSQGLNIKGSDIKRDVSYQARLNLEHYGYDPLLISKKDIHDMDETCDVLIMDIPYGVYSPFTLEQQIDLLHEASRISNRLVLVSHIDMNQYLIDEKYQIENQCTLMKGNFIRYITIASR